MRAPVAVESLIAATTVLALVAAPAAAVPSMNQAATTTCKVTVELNLVPGIGLKPSSGSFYSHGDNATCDGPVNGHRVSGPGRYESAGRIGTTHPSSCTTGGEGWGAWSITFPTDGGSYVLYNPFTFTYGAVTKSGLLAGEFEGDYASGTFSVIPTKGDCVTSPVTVARTTTQFTLHSFRP